MGPLPRRVWRRAEGRLNALPNNWLEPTESPRRLCGSTMALGSVTRRGCGNRSPWQTPSNLTNIL
jgi:hypothetical protein